MRFNSSGVRVGFVSVASSRTGDHDETNSSVAMSPDGRFDIAYQTESTAAAATAINLARYNRSDGTSRLADGPILYANRSPSSD